MMGYSYEAVDRAERDRRRDELKLTLREHCDKACALAAETKDTGSAVFRDFDPHDLAVSITHLRLSARKLTQFADELAKLEEGLRSNGQELADLGIDFAAWAAGLR
jgi:predicted metal-binding protein